MTHPFITMGKDAFEAFEKNPSLDKKTSKIVAFENLFSSTPFYFKVIPPSDGSTKGHVGFIFNENENIEDPLLFAYLERPANEPSIEVSMLAGEWLFSFAQKMRFVLCISHGDDILALTHEQQIMLDQIHQLNNENQHSLNSQTSNTPMDTGHALLSFPGEFSKWFYRYCCDHRDIKASWLMMIKPPNYDRLQLGIALDCSLSTYREHRDALHLEASKQLPPGQLLIVMDTASSQHSNIIAMLKLMPAFYLNSHSQAWWARIKRRFKRTEIPLIQQQLVDE
jgi:hypothetical protein